MVKGLPEKNKNYIQIIFIFQKIVLIFAEIVEN